MPNPENEDFATVQAAAVARAQLEERSRMTAILGTEGAKTHAALAQLFVADGIAADKAAAYLKAANDGTETAVKAAVPEIDPMAEQDAAAKDFAKKKAGAGALGLGASISTENNGSQAKAGWGRAVTNANRGVQA